MKSENISPWRVFLPVGLGTALSLMGDTSLYAVLPTHFEDAAVPLATVGILLSANRFIRLALNGPIGVIYDRLPRRVLFVPALFIGALSTAIYALTLGFWPLLAGRLLWGIAWVGIWVGGNTIILDVSRPDNRGRWVGYYQLAFFLGGSGGAIFGGLLTDRFGFHAAMGIGAGMTLLGALVALFTLPETRNLRATQTSLITGPGAAANQPAPTRWPELASAIALLGVNRLVLAGMLLPTLGRFVLNQYGDSVQVGHFNLGVATLTGLALGANGLISMAASPLLGGLSDRRGSRWPVAAAGLLPGIAGFGILASAPPLALFMAIPLTAVSGGSNQSLATALVGDYSGEQQRGQRLGILFTVGDLASAVGPLLAYALIPLTGLASVYLLCAGLLGLMFGLAWRWSVVQSGRVEPVA